MTSKQAGVSIGMVLVIAKTYSKIRVVSPPCDAGVCGVFVDDGDPYKQVLFFPWNDLYSISRVVPGLLYERHYPNGFTEQAIGTEDGSLEVLSYKTELSTDWKPKG